MSSDLSDGAPSEPAGLPVFKVSLKEHVELLEGTTVRMELVAHGDPIPKISFFKDGAPLAVNERVSVIYETPEIVEIVLEHVTAEDSGEYKVVAVNSVGEATTTGNIAVTKDKILFEGIDFEDDEAEPISQVSDINITDVLNSRLGVGTPTGSGSRPRTPAFKWFRDGKDFDASDRFQCQFDDSEDTIALVFQHVTPDDAGLYTCVASTTSGKMSCSAELTVQGDIHRLLRTPEPPAIKAEITKVEVQQGTSAMLEAKVSGYPLPKVNWFKDDEEVSADDRHKFLKEDEESYTLVVKNVQKEDAGTYTLKADNDLGGVETAGVLQVNYAPKFTKELEPKKVSVDDKLVLEVGVDASPAPDVKWYKDGQLVGESEHVKLLKGPDGKCSLIVDKAQVSDAGAYSVVVSNASGQQTGFAKVDVAAPPKFEGPMKDFAGKEGETAEFKVKVCGSPKPKVTFLKEQQALKVDEERVTVEEVDGVYTLTIRKVSKTDVGVYTCVAKNEHGSKESDASLTIKMAPTFKRGLSDFEAREGDVDVELTVIIEGSPKPEIRWLYEEKEIRESETYKFVDGEGGTCIMRITKVTSEMVGMYTCEAKNSEGVSKSSSKMTVNAKPNFAEGLKDAALVPGAELSLKVKATGYPAPEVSWTKNGTVLTDGERIKITVDGTNGEHTLIISGSSEIDAGKYGVTAKNIFGEVSTTANVAMASKPKFKVGLVDVSAQQDQQDITFAVETDSSPVKPKLRWFVDDIEIVEADKRYKQINEPDKDKYSLVIKSANEGTAGTYKAKASNAVGDTETQCELSVAAAPQFMQGLEDREAKEGDEIVMEIVTAGQPTPKVKFTKDGRELSIGGDESSPLRIEQESDNVYILSIPKASKESAGNYEVVLTNKVGEARSKGALSVLTKPLFVQDLMDKTSVVGEDDFIEVTVDGCPRPSIVWFRDGTQIPTTIMAEHTDNHFRLRFEPVEPQDNAEYYCEAKNKVGTTASRKAKFVVSAGKDFSAPVFEKALKDTSIVGGDAVRLDIKVRGVPLPTVKWLKDGQEIADSRIVTKDEGSGDHSLTIRRTQDGDAGRYSVVAKNKVGEVTTEANLVIQEAKQPTVDGLKDLEVDYLTCAQFECTITGVPTPVVTWLKDGKEVSFDNNVVSSRDGDVYKLAIRCTAEANVGKYSVQASNSAGVAGGVASLSIIPRPPKFSGGTDDYKLDIGQPLSMDVKVSGYPAPKVTWQKDGVDIVDGGKYAISSKGDSQKLAIRRVGEDDLGTYTLKAVNGVGDAVTVGVKVGLNEVGPSLLKGLPDGVKITGGDVLRLEGRVGGTPLPETKWLRDGIDVVPDGDRINVERKPDGTVVLTIKDSSPDESGRYELVATNPLGRSSTGSDVVVSAKPRLRPGSCEKFYDFGEELGRGTQGITSGATEKTSGKKFAVKAMHGKDNAARDWMMREYEAMNSLPLHPRLVNLYSAYQSADKDSLYLINDHCENGHLLDYLTKRSGHYTENDVRRYIRQTLEGLEYMHGRNMGHFGITIGNILVDGASNLRLNDFSLSQRFSGRGFRIEHGHPEFVAPEILDNQVVTMATDMWSVGVLTYLLLSGRSPFLGDTDRDTLKNIESKKLSFKHEAFLEVSENAKSFMSCLLDFDPKLRITVREALEHAWLRIDVDMSAGDKALTTASSSLREYHGRWRSWYANASTKKWFRRRALDTCFIHKSRMIYPPEDVPVARAEREPIRVEYESRSRRKLVHETIDIHSESHYQQGPDTYLLQHRDVEYPLRVREYLRVSSQVSPSFAKQLQEGHWGDVNLGYGFSPQVAVRERRKFNEVYKEIVDERIGDPLRPSPITRKINKLKIIADEQMHEYQTLEQRSTERRVELERIRTQVHDFM